MKKMQVVVSAILLLAMLSIANLVFPVYVTATPITVETNQALNFDGIEVRAKRTDIIQYGQWFVKIEAETIVNGTKISIKSDLYPLSKLEGLMNLKSSKKPARYDSTILSSATTVSLYATQNLPKYRWDNIEFVRAPGDAYTWVKYDHPNNYDRYYPGQINRDYTLTGTSKFHHHISRTYIENAKYKASFAQIAGLLGPIIAGLLLIPELVSKVVAGIIALVGSVLSLFGFLMKWFIENIIQTELLDGWIWTWGWGRLVFLWWTLSIWFWISFGSLRDWGFYVYIPL